MPISCSFSRLAALAFCLLLLLAGLPHAGAVNVPGAAAQPAPTSSPVVPIPIQDILVRANEEQQRIESARQLLARTAQFDAVRAALEEIAVSVNAKLDSTSRIALRGLPVMRLESLARHYDFDARRMQA